MSYFQHIGTGALVIASFQQTLWTVQTISSGAIRQKSLGKLCYLLASGKTWSENINTVTGYKSY